jgi:isopenicillin-N epimerase
MIDRRRFLEGAVAASVVSGITSAKAAGPAASSGSLSWQAVKREFDLDYSQVQLAQFFMTSHPRVVRDAIEHHRKQLDRNPFTYIEDNVAGFERGVREAAARYVGGVVDAIAMTDNTTMGIGLVYNGVAMRPEQEVLTTDHDHPATVHALVARAARGDLKVRTIPLYKDIASVSADEIVGTLRKAILPATRLLGLTWVHSATGLKLPVAQIVAMVADLNRGRASEADRILIALDGVHGFGVEAEQASSLGVDLFMTGCHKWIFGPRGTGLVWGSPAGWAVMRPTITSFDIMWRHTHNWEEMPMASQITPGGFHAFEHRWALSEAFGFHEKLGRERVTARIHELGQRVKNALAGVPGITVHTPRSDALSAGLVSFNIKDRKPDDIVAGLRAKGILCSASPYPKFKAVRFAPSLLTDEADLDKAVQALRGLA